MINEGTKIETGWTSTLNKLLEFDNAEFISRNCDKYVYSPLIKLCKNKKLSEKAQLELFEKRFLPINMALATCTNLLPKLREELLNINNELVDINLSLNKFIDKETIEVLINKGNFKVIGCLASWNENPEQFLKFNNIFVYTCLAANPNITFDFCKKIREEFIDWDIEYSLSKNENCPIEVLNEIVDKGDKEMKLNICHHKNLQKELIDKLIVDKDPDIRKEIIRCHFEHLSLEQLWNLCEDCSFEVTEELAQQELPEVIEVKLIESNVYGSINEIQFNKY